jgi:hypothetical protein
MDGFTFAASLLAAEGAFGAEKYWQPEPEVELVLRGSVQSREDYGSNTSDSGFRVIRSYDWRLSAIHPPYYPRYEPETVVAEEGASVLPEPIALEVSDNPFKESTTISSGEGAADFSYRIYDLAGRLLCEGESSEGLLFLCGAALPPGVLVLRASSGGE